MEGGRFGGGCSSQLEQKKGNLAFSCCFDHSKRNDEHIGEEAEKQKCDQATVEKRTAFGGTERGRGGDNQARQESYVTFVC